MQPRAVAAALAVLAVLAVAGTMGLSRLTASQVSGGSDTPRFGVAATLDAGSESHPALTHTDGQPHAHTIAGDDSSIDEAAAWDPAASGSGVDDEQDAAAVDTEGSGVNHESGDSVAPSHAATPPEPEPRVWNRCSPPRSAEALVDLQPLPKVGWDHPPPQSLHFGQCLDAPAAEPLCYCPGSQAVTRIESVLGTQPTGVFNMGTGASPKWGLQFADGSRAVWKPWGDGLAEYLTYKTAQVLGSCHVPPVVPLALSPGFPKLYGKLAQPTDQRSQARVRYASRTTKSGSVSYGVAVYMVPNVTVFRYTHILQAAYGFGPRFGAVWEDKNCGPPYTANTYEWWKHVSSSEVTDAPWIGEAEAASIEAAQAGRESRAGAPMGDGTGSSESSSGSGDGTARTVHRRRLRVASLADGARGGRNARGLGAKRQKAKKRKKKRRKGSKCLVTPAVPALVPSRVSPEHRIQQVRDLLADVSDQMVLDLIVRNPDRNRNHHVTNGWCGPRVSIDQANAGVFHPVVHGDDRYALPPINTTLHGGVNPLCKYRRTTVQRLRELAERRPRSEVLAGTTVASQGRLTADARGSVLPRHDGKQGDDLCLLAGELAASIPHPPNSHADTPGDGMLWYARAMLRDGSTLDSLCDRLDAVLEAIDVCVETHGEARVMGELDAAAAACEGACFFKFGGGQHYHQRVTTV